MTTVEQVEVRQAIDTWIAVERRTRSYLSREASMGEAQLSRIVNGKIRPGKKVLAKLEVAMGLSPGTLRNESETAGGEAK